MMNPSAFMAASHHGLQQTAPSFIPSNAPGSGSSVINGVDTPGSMNELVSALNNCNNHSSGNLFTPSHQTSSFLQCSPSGHMLPGSRDVFSGLHNPMAHSPVGIGQSFQSSRQPNGVIGGTDHLFDFTIMPSIDYHRNPIGDLYSGYSISGSNRNTNSLTDISSNLGGAGLSPTASSRPLMNVGTPTSGYPQFSPIKSQTLSSMVSGNPLDSNASPADRFGLFDPSGYFYPQYNLKPSDLKAPNMYSPYSAVMSDKFSYYQAPSFYSQGYDSFESAAAFAYASATKPNPLAYSPTKPKEEVGLDSHTISPFLHTNHQQNKPSTKNRNGKSSNSNKNQNENNSANLTGDSTNGSHVITNKELTEGEVDTRDLAHRITAELKRYSIPQAVFAEKVTI